MKLLAMALLLSTTHSRNLQTMCIQRFIDCSKLGGYDPADECKQTCSLKEEAMPMMCTMQYTECGHLGGYDPVDPCNHTCMQKDESLDGNVGGDESKRGEEPSEKFVLEANMEDGQIKVRMTMGSIIRLASTTAAITGSAFTLY